MTAQGLINAAMQSANILASGETPSSDESADALIQLNEILASWSAVGLNCFGTGRFSQALSNATGTYTIGSGGAFNTTRPLSISAANIITSGDGLYFPLKIGSESDLSAVLERATPVKVPRVLFYDGAYPLGTIYLAPYPSGTPTLELFVWQQLTALSTLGTSFDMPPGYEYALRLALAVAICPNFGKPIDQGLMADALNARAALRGLNAPPAPGHAQEAQAAGAATPVSPGDQNAVTR